VIVIDGRVDIAAAAIVAIATATACGCGPRRDTVEKTTDVHVTPQPEGYVHIARRAHGTVALAEARALPEADAIRWVERWADLLDDCAARLERENKLEQGAARVVVVLDPAGQIAGTNVKTSEGAAAVVTTLQCLMVPIKSTPFPPGTSDAGSRGIAIEASWNRGPTTLTRPTVPTASAAAAPRDGG
jgi:hypothetical protein